jgi:hypothetical protein
LDFVILSEAPRGLSDEPHPGAKSKDLATISRSARQAGTGSDFTAVLMAGDVADPSVAAWIVATGTRGIAALSG